MDVVEGRGRPKVRSQLLGATTWLTTPLLPVPLYNAVLATFFEWGIAIYAVELERAWRGEKSRREALS